MILVQKINLNGSFHSPVVGLLMVTVPILGVNPFRDIVYRIYCVVIPTQDINSMTDISYTLPPL